MTSHAVALLRGFLTVIIVDGDAEVGGALDPDIPVLKLDVDREVLILLHKHVVLDADVKAGLPSITTAGIDGDKLMHLTKVIVT